MTSESSWISLFIQQVLPVYLDQTTQDDVEVEDDGSSISFRLRNYGHGHTATVAEWGMGPSDDEAVLNDAKLRIDAIIAPDLLPVYSIDATTAQPIATNPKKYSIRLLDFKLVVPHKTRLPNPHLFINKFHIEWDKGTKGLVPKKKLQNYRDVRGLLNTVYDKAKSLRGAVHSTPRSSAPPQNNVQDNISNQPAESQQISSQVPLDVSRSVYEANTIVPRPYGTEELLRRLGPTSLAASDKTVIHDVNAEVLRGGHMDNDVNATQGSPLAQSPNRNHSPSTPRRNSICSQIETSPDVRHDKTEFKDLSPSHSTMQPPPKKRQRSEHDQDGNRIPGPRGNSPPLKRQRVGSTTELHAHDLEIQHQKLAEETATLSHSELTEPIATIHVPSSPQRSVTSRPSPWEGPNQITSSDFIIPKNQQELLEEDKLCWIPPCPRDPMPQGHVPPLLLRQWNNAVKRRHLESGNATVEIEEHDSDPQGPITSTQESDASSIASDPSESFHWSPSPERPSRVHQNDLPPSSPVRRLAPRKQRSLATGTGYKNVSPQPPKNNAEFRDLPQTCASDNPAQFPAQTTTQDKARSKSPLDPKAAASNEGGNQQPFSQLSGTPAPNQETTMKSPVPSSRPEPIALAREEEDSDEDSVMDTSVPFALGETMPDPTQSSRVEEDLVSSGPSLPAVNGESVQVAVTPVAGSDRLHLNPNQESNQAGPLDSNLISSQIHETSSQSRILDTYPFNARHEQSQSSHEAPTPSRQGQDTSFRLDVPVTQLPTSSMASLWRSQSQPQNAADSSQPDIVLDSSGPAQRQQDFYISATQSSPIALTSGAGHTGSQLNESTKPDPMKAANAINEPMSSPRVRSSPVPTPFEPPHRDSDDIAQGIEGNDVQAIDTQTSSLVARRRGFVNNTETHAEAWGVYKRFCSDYPSYSGSFDHFTKLCGMLLAVRKQGKLHRSFLWDDFVTMHLTSYPQYLENNGLQDALNYEDYFFDNFSRPSLRKRSLTARGIEFVASQCAPGEAIDNAIPAVPSSEQCTMPGQTPSPALNKSFTGSLVEKFAGLYARSHVVSEGGLSLKSPDDKRPSNPPSVEIKREGSASDPIGIDSTQTGPPPSSALEPLTRWSPQAAEAHGPSSTASAGAEVEKEKATHMEVEMEVEAADVQMQEDMEEVPETDPEDVGQDEDSFHETASVELGDETFVSSMDQRRPSPRVQVIIRKNYASFRPRTPDEKPSEARKLKRDILAWQASATTVDETALTASQSTPAQGTPAGPSSRERRREKSPAEDTRATAAEPIPASPQICEPESENENWFSSLRHIRPKGPVWSDGPTEFKRWAEADQNVLRERKRRGGTKILLDENGVIRRPNQR
ncbi:hypothetical protein N7466_000797 [Penicillium verhagenii]|uniref:uncharacterized protein n=1 Tax=Penicillium verhagenii TaxID=1562060 RepID=UPI002545A9B8|nr:uncharacterized protein N7466_000797 [Penicillium verhagenii]KAJ5947782.1 hypothetical protein N7466_000797 [Penicillium verhagenii]